MTKEVSQQQFDSALPRYVSLAYAAVDTFFDKALAGPDDRIGLMSRMNWDIGWNTDFDTLNDYWQVRDEEAGQRRYIAADIVMETGRLCLERNYWHCKAWLYQPPNTPKSWANNPDKYQPENLLSPVLQFGKPVDDFASGIRMGLFPIINKNILVYDVSKDIHNVTAEDYAQAQRPRLSSEENRLLKQEGVYSLHIRKVENMLEVMRLVALQL